MAKESSEASAKVEAYIEKAPEYARPILRKLRGIILRSDERLVEAIKWGAPSYSLKGLVCSIGAFKRHAGLWFHKGALLKDPKKILEKSGAQQMRSIKLASPEDLDEKTILAYVREAVAIDEKGVRVKPAARPVVVPPALSEALAKHPKAKTFFDSLAPSHRREYAGYIAEAKKPETVERRLAKTLEELAEGRKPHEKYRSPPAKAKGKAKPKA
jgi:uncharacterized protein YdeI (YjbR/CyaY-like superfamily)